MDVPLFVFSTTLETRRPAYSYVDSRVTETMLPSAALPVWE